MFSGEVDGPFFRDMAQRQIEHLHDRFVGDVRLPAGDSQGDLLCGWPDRARQGEIG